MELSESEGNSPLKQYASTYDERKPQQVIQLIPLKKDEATSMRS